MKKVIVREREKIPPFNEPARDLRVLNKPLWLYVRDVLARHCTEEIEVESLSDFCLDEKETLIIGTICSLTKISLILSCKKLVRWGSPAR